MASKWSLFLLGLFVFSEPWGTISCDREDMKKFETSGILTDMKIKMPSSLLRVKYESHEVEPGIVLTPTQVKNQPIVDWEVDRDAIYAIVMHDPDAPSRQNPTSAEYQHWCVVNIPGSNVTLGQVLTEYKGAGPPKGTGQHRYVLLVFKQPAGVMDFSDSRPNSRAKQHIAEFAAAHSLGDPVAGNFYLAEFEAEGRIASGCKSADRDALIAYLITVLGVVHMSKELLD